MTFDLYHAVALVLVHGYTMHLPMYDKGSTTSNKTNHRCKLQSWEPSLSKNTVEYNLCAPPPPPPHHLPPENTRPHRLSHLDTRLSFHHLRHVKGRARRRRTVTAPHAAGRAFRRPVRVGGRRNRRRNLIPSRLKHWLMTPSRNPRGGDSAGRSAAASGGLRFLSRPHLVHGADVMCRAAGADGNRGRAVASG